ncbi:MAG: hypothetical protein KGN33_18895 [Paracoccaceae bacterium]|nr:hypothetical protein [Paracoccaceae bacterium]
MVTRFLNWALKEELLKVHNHHGVERLHKSNHSMIIWLPAEIDALLEVATEREGASSSRHRKAG